MKKSIIRILMIIVSVAIISFISIELVTVFKNYNLCKESESANALVVKERIKNSDGTNDNKTFLLYYVNNMYYNILTNDNIEDEKSVVEICYNIKNPSELNIIDKENVNKLTIINVVLFVMLGITICIERKNNKSKTNKI